MRMLALSCLLALLSLPGCAGCEDTVCCAIDGHAIPRILRPSQCSLMGGRSVPPAMCDAVCCEASDGSHAIGTHATCANVVEPSLCDVADGG